MRGRRIGEASHPGPPKLRVITTQEEEHLFGSDGSDTELNEVLEAVGLLVSDIPESEVIPRIYSDANPAGRTTGAAPVIE